MAAPAMAAVAAAARRASRGAEAMLLRRGSPLLLRRASSSPSVQQPRCIPDVGSLVSRTDVETYKEHGVVHLPGVLPQAWVDYIRVAFDEAVQKPSAHAEFIGEGVTWETMFDSDARERRYEMFQDQDASRRVPEFRYAVRNSPAAGIMARLMGSSTAVFFYEHLILKRPAAERPIPWHQDLPYWKVDGSMIGSVWIPLDPMPAEASVRYIAGSHRWGLFQPRHFVDATPYAGVEHLPPLPNVDALLASGEVQGLAFDTQPGDVVCFDARIVHGSPGNHDPSNIPHRRVAFRFGGDDAVYCERPGETAIPSPEVDREHGLSHGEPLACDTFPRVWP